MSALDELVKHHIENVCRETDKEKCPFVQDLTHLRAQAAECDTLQQRNKALEAAISSGLDQIENGDIRVAWKLLNDAYAAPAPAAEEQAG